MGLSLAPPLRGLDWQGVLASGFSGNGRGFIRAITADGAEAFSVFASAPFDDSQIYPLILAAAPEPAAQEVACLLLNFSIAISGTIDSLAYRG
jgi:hypothetical protein